MDEFIVDARGNIWGVESPALLAQMPKGIMGFNGRVDTPNYKLVDGVPVERTGEEMALDPYSDEPEPETPDVSGSADEAMDIIEGRAE